MHRDTGRLETCHKDEPEEEPDTWGDIIWDQIFGRK